RRARLPAHLDPYLLRERLTCGCCGGALAIVRPKPRHVYYRCLRSLPSGAREQLAPLCALPGLPATALEPLVWDAVRAALPDPATLTAGLEAGRAEYAAAAARWAAQRKTLDRALARQRKDLKALVVAQARARPGSRPATALAEAIAETDATIARLERERREAE